MLRANAGTDARSRFRVVRQLGSGGYGAVVEAIDQRTGQHVAVKELQDVTAASIARFKQEFRVLADRHHPNLVGLHELIEEDGQWRLVMELIPGSDLIAYARGGADNDNARFSEARVRSAFTGMAEGLVALHGYGLLHRDLKPSNVRVTPSGRAVLLDFGLVTNIASDDAASVVGTVAYMAPEQATGRSVGPPVDWYAFGVCLFEVLTGRLPIAGQSANQLLAEKQQKVAPRAASLAPEIPPDLDRLCAALLARDPNERPQGADVLNMLGEGSASPPTSVSMFSAAPGPPVFAGRDAELQVLERALLRTRLGELKLVLVEGESGVGKSELVAEFLRRTRMREPELTVLSGRCYENEQVSYKAFDGCIDDLARLLRRLPESDCTQILPPRAAVLGQLFPVLRTVSAINNAPRGNIAADLTARRLEAFGALTALLRRLDQDRPLVLVIDDLQWADAESFRLMRALLEHAEPPPILLLCTLRPRAELDADVLAQVDHLRGLRQTERVPVVGLPPGQTEQLAAKLLSSSVPAAWLRTIASESEGHPLFLSELVHYARSHELGALSAVSLEAALRSRIELLEPAQRALLEIVCLAARPYGAHIFARALGAQGVEHEARALTAVKLLRLRHGRELGAYHDRIRNAAVALIAPPRVAQLHRRLAEALADDAHADVSEQALHWDLAGDVARAIDAYADAARSAFDALAFSRAVNLATRALALIGDERDPRFMTLTMQRADALACAGKSADAAVDYQRAADHAQGDVRLRLRGRVAEQLMLSADMKRGFEAARVLVGELGAHIPLNPLASLLRLAYDRLWIHLSRPFIKFPPPSTYDPSKKVAYELIDSLIVAMGILHPPAFLILLTFQMRFGRRSFIPEGNAQVHSIVGWFHAMDGDLTTAMEMFAEGRRLCAELGDPVVTARQQYIEGAALLNGSEWASAIESLERAHALAQAHARDNPALLVDIRVALGSALYTVGAYDQLITGMATWLADAHERNDRRSLAILTGLGHGFLRHLMLDAPEQAREELDRTVRLLPEEPFSFVHLGYTMGMMITLLSQGGPRALRWLEEREPRHRRALLLRTSMGRRMLRVYGALALLAAASAATESARPALLRRARRGGHALLRDSAQYVHIYGLLVLSQVEALEGSRERALELARMARERAEATKVGVVRGLSYLVAILEHGHDRNLEAQRVREALREQGFSNPLRALLITVPALPLLAPEAQAAAIEAERYEVLDAPARGDDRVIVARDLRTDRRVRLRALAHGPGRSLERFTQEFAALQAIAHPNLVPLDGLVEYAGRWYVVTPPGAGEPLLAYVRPLGVLQPERLREAFTGIAQGLAALHAAGFVHRALCPDGVEVTSDALALLRDLGAVARIGDAQAGPAPDSAHAAPEQRAGDPPRPSADVYALGACLHHALTGRPPSPDAPLAMPEESGLEDVMELCARMIARAPESRPSLREILTHLRGEAAPRGARMSLPEPGPAPVEAPFVGREDALERLGEAFEATPDDGFVVALVEGESGIGKSALAGHFARHLEETFPRILVLRGRCRARVAFNAFDAPVARLAEALRALPSVDCEALLPAHAALLTQLFPVLASVPAIAQSSPDGLPAELLARRSMALASFVELLERLTARFELLLVIDDLHACDGDSLGLLARLAARGERLPMLLVGTVRAACDLTPSAAAVLGALRAHPNVRALRLEGLAEGDVRALVAGLYPDAQSPVQLARASKGNPLLLRALTALARAGAPIPGNITLDHALHARVDELAPEPRTLLALVALSERAHADRVYARAMDRHELPRAALALLLEGGFLRRERGDALACDHDRVRAVTLDSLTPAARMDHARQLASALDPERSADAAERARLWDEAGDAERAIVACEQAAAHAEQALAFVQAEQHHARAVALLGALRDARWQRVSLAHAHALERIGRREDAARAFELVAANSEGALHVRARILAVQRLIQSAQVEPGLRAARALLAELALPTPGSDERAWLRLGWDRGLLALRGLAFRPPGVPPSRQTRLRLEAAWSLSLPLSWLDPLASAVLSARHLRMALSAGDPGHVARSLAEEAFVRAVQDPADRRIDPLIDRARLHAGGSAEAALEAQIKYREGAIASARWQLPKAAEALEQSLRIATERCPDATFLRANIRAALGMVWGNTGQHARLTTASRAWLEEAEARGDRFATAMLTGLGLGTLPALMDDAPERALEELAHAHAPWPRDPFSYAHLGELIGTCYANFYRGGDAALRFLQAEQPRLARAFLLKTPLGANPLTFLQAVARLHACAVAKSAEATALLAQVRALTWRLERTRSAFAAVAAPSLRMMLAAVERRPDEARALVAKVRQHGAQTAHFYAMHPPLYLDGLLEGGQTGRAKREAALASYASLGWKNPRCAIAMFMPAIDVLEPRAL